MSAQCIKIKACVNGEVVYTSIKAYEINLLKIKERAVRNLRTRSLRKFGVFNLTDISYLNNDSYSRFPS